MIELFVDLFGAIRKMFKPADDSIPEGKMTIVDSIVFTTQIYPMNMS